MSTLSKYKRDARKMFFMSVKKDLNKWTGSGDFYSPEYNRSTLRLDREPDRGILSIVNIGNTIHICTYRFLFIPIDIKVWWYARKINRKYIKDQREKKRPRRNKPN
jgi:hypothetical protein